MEDQKPLPPAPPLADTLTDIFTSPAEIFQSLKDTAPAPKLWIVPLIASLLAAIIIVAVLFTNETLKSEMKVTQSKAMQKMVDERKLTQEQAEQAETRTESMGSMFIVFGVVGAAIFLAIYFFGGALFIWFAGKMFLKSTSNYEKHLEMYGISSWIGVLGAALSQL